MSAQPYLIASPFGNVNYDMFVRQPDGFYTITLRNVKRIDSSIEVGRIYSDGVFNLTVGREHERLILLNSDHYLLCSDPNCENTYSYSNYGSLLTASVIPSPDLNYSVYAVVIRGFKQVFLDELYYSRQIELFNGNYTPFRDRPYSYNLYINSLN
jgi:hypothetical protein